MGRGDVVDGERRVRFRGGGEGGTPKQAVFEVVERVMRMSRVMGVGAGAMQKVPIVPCPKAFGGPHPSLCGRLAQACQIREVEPQTLLLRVVQPHAFHSPGALQQEG